LTRFVRLMCAKRKGSDVRNGAKRKEMPNNPLCPFHFHVLCTILRGNCFHVL
jgi:hypothetical protein